MLTLPITTSPIDFGAASPKSTRKIEGFLNDRVSDGIPGDTSSLMMENRPRFGPS